MERWQTTKIARKPRHMDNRPIFLIREEGTIILLREGTTRNNGMKREEIMLQKYEWTDSKVQKRWKIESREEKEAGLKKHDNIM